MPLPRMTATRRLSASQAKSRLADCLRKAEHGQSVIITRNGKPVAAIVAVDQVALPKPKGARASPAPTGCTLVELVGLLRGGPKADRGYWETLAAITRRQPNLSKSPRRRYRRRVSAAVLVLFTCAFAACTGTASTSSLATTTASGAADQIPIAVMKPDGPGPFPTVVIMHDCSGLGGRS